MNNTEIANYNYVTEQFGEVKEYLHSLFNELLEIQNEISDVKSHLAEIDKKMEN